VCHCRWLAEWMADRRGVGVPEVPRPSHPSWSSDPISSSCRSELDGATGARSGQIPGISAAQFPPHVPQWLIELIESADGVTNAEVIARAQKLMGLVQEPTGPVEADPTDDVLDPLHEALWHEFEAWDPSPASDEVVALGTAWWVVTNRQARSAVVLRRQGADIDGMPNARTAFEHAMGVAWLSRAQGVPAIRNLTLRWIRDGVAGFKLAVETFPRLQGLIDGIAALPVSGEIPSGKLALRPGDFKWLTGELGIQDVGYLYYPTLSSFVHPSLAPLMALSAVSPAGPAIHRAPVRSQPEINARLWAVQCQCWAGLALDRILGGGLPFRDRVNDASNGIKLPLRDRLFPA
jgi:hypothetical protein